MESVKNAARAGFDAMIASGINVAIIGQISGRLTMSSGAEAGPWVDSPWGEHRAPFGQNFFANYERIITQVLNEFVYTDHQKRRVKRGQFFKGVFWAQPPRNGASSWENLDLLPSNLEKVREISMNAKAKAVKEFRATTENANSFWAQYGWIFFFCGLAILAGVFGIRHIVVSGSNGGGEEESLLLRNSRRDRFDDEYGGATCEGGRHTNLVIDDLDGNSSEENILFGGGISSDD